ncbi:hypothetical protein Cs7R123_79290 [Catellatospora sp. TT07R-123]|nr:hypothetical protein Cs7R123_79290 [Catellatospora sp. TT07R-123]
MAVRIVVDRPIAQVFGYLSDLRHDPQWWGGVRAAARLTGDGGVGTVYELDTVLLGVRDVIRLEVVAQQPPVTQTITVRQGRLPYTAHYEWTALEPGRTAFRLVAEVAAVRPWSWLGPLFSPVLSLLARRYFRRVPAVIEASVPGG